jgi:hypothetical protein
MTLLVPLRKIAHARAGDKGNRSNISIFVYDIEHYPLLVGQVTPERLKQAFEALFRGQIRRYLLPQLYGLNIVLDEALEGGVNESLNLDSHGKSWSSLILSLEIELP